jgi:hypothetical protein
MKIIFALLILCPSINASAALSAHRDAWRTAESYYPTRPQMGRSSASAYASKQSLAKLDLNSVAAAPDLSFVQREFAGIRDNRFLTSADDSSFLRRISWLYPDDGCYARAEMMARAWAKQKAAKPPKVFIFGNLKVQTPNSNDGEVTWWYHVAIAYRTAEGVFILDPAVEPKNPLLLADWIHLINPSGGKEPKLSLCSDKTFDPNSDCNASEAIPADSAISQAEDFLPSEWDRILELHRDPKRELGDFPPWL